MRRSTLVLTLTGAIMLPGWGSEVRASQEAGAGNLFAVVSAAGDLVAGGGVTSVGHPAPGSYEVTFDTNVGGCAFVATPRRTVPPAKVATTALGQGPETVIVGIADETGAPVDGPFDLVVACDTEGISFAVVDANGFLARGTPGVSVRRAGTGRFTVVFPTLVVRCAFVASVGDAGAGQPPDGVGVYTGSGSNGVSVNVETKNAGGGLTGNVPFHLAVVCPRTPLAEVAVVASDGIIDRGSRQTSSLRLATGRYGVVTDVDLTACATVATRGSVNAVVPFTPATVEVSGGPARNAVRVDVRELAFFGGAYLDEAFHTASLC